jgi:hypothetical protein
VKALLLVAALLSLPAAAATRTYVLAIGNNTPPADGDGEALSPLQYADDDAAAFFTFARTLSAKSILLTVLDAPSARRFPALAELSRPPSLVELRRAVAELRQDFEADARAGNESVLLFFYSGHGTRGSSRPASLALLDEPLTREVLYGEVLAALPARYIHLIVDACHAEAVVRPRDGEAKQVAVTDADLQTWTTRETLARFPQVGALLATAAGAQSHEWDVFEQGVFSHELISGLRGAADVDGDGRVEYSELAAFLGAANREVADPRAQLAVVVHPPAINRRAPIVDLKEARGQFRLVGRPSRLGRLFIEDERGNRLADVRAEPEFRVSLLLPAVEKLFIRGADGETVLRAAADAIVALDELRLASVETRPRGAVESSLHRGLFAAEYGPRYYRGYVDQNPELAAVPLPSVPAEPAIQRAAVDKQALARRDRRTGLTLVGVSAGFAVVAVVLGALAADSFATLASTNLERPAQQAHDRALPLAGVAAASLAVAAATAAAGGWLTVRAGRESRLTARLSPTGASIALAW